jgi:RNA polymerase sigma-70 factor (ECF subfamily)
VGPAEAEDLVQNTLERALSHADRFQHGTNLGAWLRRIMSNLMVDDWRRSRHHFSCLADDVPAPAPEPRPAWHDVDVESVWAAVEALPPRLRRAFQMHTAGASYAEIARQLGIPTATVGTRLVRARLHLRRTLTGERTAPVDDERGPVFLGATSYKPRAGALPCAAGDLPGHGGRDFLRSAGGDSAGTRSARA